MNRANHEQLQRLTDRPDADLMLVCASEGAGVGVIIVPPSGGAAPGLF